MARRNSEPSSSVDRAKVRVFFAEVEGNNESVQEALKTMVSAMSRPVRVLSDQRSNGRASALLEQTESEEVEEAIDQAERSRRGKKILHPKKPRSPVAQVNGIAIPVWPWCLT